MARTQQQRLALGGVLVVGLPAAACACGLRSTETRADPADDRQGQAPALGAEPATARLDYAIRYVPEGDPHVLAVQLEVADLRVSGERAVLRLRDWGEWTSAAHAYLRDLRVDGSPRVLAGDGSFAVPPELLADGRLHVSYELLPRRQGSPEHDERRLLPHHTDHHVFAFVANTLIGIAVDDAPQPARVSVRVDAAADQHVFTGWNGFSVGPQTGAAPATLVEGNGIFAIGRSFGRAASDIDGTPLEVVQFADGPDATAELAEIARTIVGSMTRATGRGPWNAVRVFVEGAGGGGTHTDSGTVIHLPESLPVPGDNVRVFAHELCHHWLGSHLVDDGSLVWFSEGFTDYLALWHATATGLSTPQRFAERILAVERAARASSSLGHRAFADPDIDWRDGDGPNETMAYRGGALLAFVVDHALRQRGLTVNDVVRGLLESAPRQYQLVHVRQVLTSLGLSDLYEQSVAGTQVPSARPLLLELGFEETTEEAALTYLGIEARYDGPADSTDAVPAIVTAIDPTGPAAAGVLPGDRIVGYGDRRGNPPELGPDAPARHRFGLSVIPSGARSIRLDLVRDGEARQVEIAPVLVPGGRRAMLRWNPERRTGFLDPR